MQGIAAAVTLLAFSAGGTSRAQLDGHWAKLAKLESITKIPVFGDITQKTEVLSLIELKTEPDGQMRYRERTCRLTSKTFAGMIKTAYPPAFLGMLTRDWSPVYLKQDGDQLSFVQQKNPRDYGKDRADQDRDGHPGVTIEVSGMIGGEIYASIREWSTSLGRVVDNNTIEGRIEWDVGLKVLGGSSERLSSQPKTRRNQDPSVHTFVMKRVRDNADCQRLLDQEDDVF